MSSVQWTIDRRASWRILPCAMQARRPRNSHVTWVVNPRSCTSQYLPRARWNVARSVKHLHVISDNYSCRADELAVTHTGARRERSPALACPAAWTRGHISVPSHVGDSAVRDDPGEPGQRGGEREEHGDP